MAVNKRLIGAGAAGSAFVNDQNFRVVTYTGNSNTQAITGVGFQPDWVWIKERSQAENHNFIDSSRGTNKIISSNLNNAEFTSSRFTSFDADGFTLANNNETNDNGVTYVAWCWKANGGTTSTNSDGNLNSTVQANVAAGFSVITYTGTTGSSKTIGHGLGVEPSMYITKRLNHADAWRVTAKVIEGFELDLAGNSAKFQDGAYPDYATSSVIKLGTGSAVHTNGGEYVTYCFADVAGYQEIDSYSGNGSANGPIVNIGFEPAFLMIKRTDSSDNWTMYDNKRTTTNPRNLALFPNLTSAELSSGLDVDFLSNGFQIKSSDNSLNNSSGTYLYWAIAANPDTEAPTLASSFKTVTYTGTGASRSISGLGFGPGFVWIKHRDGTGSHSWTDVVRGDDLVLQSNENGAEASGQINLDSDGFTIRNDNALRNSNGANYVAWNWKADDNEPTINTNGSITSITSVNANAGFSIVGYVGTGSNATVGHGLSQSPNMIIIKRRDGGAGFNWIVGHTGLSFTSNETLTLDSSGSKATFNYFNATNPTSTVFSLGTGANTGSTNTDGGNYIAYCFHDVTGYSKFGSYTGTGSSNSITTGFKTDFLIVKEADGVDSWEMYDSLRGSNKVVYPNGNNAEVTGSTLTSFDSNGFTVSSATSINESGKTYIYWAVAMNPTLNTALASSFKAITYTGTGSAQSITGVGFQPDLVWMKDRGNTREHILSDSVRGTIREISSDTSDAEETDRGVGSFDTDGFSLPDGNTNYNASSQNYVAWCWKAGNNYVSNINGTIPSIVNANSSNGFSIVKWNGDGSASATVGHGLSSKPDWVIVKDLTEAGGWNVAHVGLASNEGISLNSSAAAFTSMGNNGGITYGNLTATTFGFATGAVGVDSVNKSGNDYIAYCWHGVSGFSKFGSYTGNGSSQNITGLGFQPDFVINKARSSSHDWNVTDSARGNQKGLNPNTHAVEGAQSPFGVTFISDGFTVADNSGGGASVNGNGIEYIYMAFKMN